MNTWLLLLGGLLAWAVHFFGVYAIAEILGATRPARIATLVLTSLCLAASGWIAWQGMRLTAEDDFARWLRSVAVLGAILSAIAVIWQALPAIF